MSTTESLEPGTWEPHTVTADVYVDPAPVAALQALLDDGSARVGPGDPLPPLWHWVALPRWAPSSSLATDGHPRKGSFLPPVSQPRRMWAGGAVSFPGTLRVGETARSESEVVSVEHKTGRSGDLVIVQVATRLYDGSGELAVEERQDLVYRDAAAPGDRSQAGVLLEQAVGTLPAAPLTRAGEWSWELTTDPTLLMRFSAATGNAHRIHYDWPYATQVEGYPGLVVHGPLMSLALAEVVRLESPGSRVGRITHRNLAPLLCGAPARLRVAERTSSEQGEDVALQLLSEDKPRVALTATILQ
ncbi:FAS1-like dehydratase domain-containing protein [Nocardioides insulae]|uniref:FAS1-like dehydratase domain-containing protein n=1 Tax=Nocardioides insulae TaxID=394734 RepID=UPI0003FD105F|nr:MaoC family dehydratase N-terminal domain-containing protein [Nocardioides insulae]